MKSKQQLIEENNNLINENKILNELLSKKLKIEELEQNKVYYIKVDSKEEGIIMKTEFEYITHQIPWTLPKIILTTKDFCSIKSDK